MGMGTMMGNHDNRVDVIVTEEVTIATVLGKVGRLGWV